MTEEERYTQEIEKKEQREAEYQEYLRYVEETQLDEEYFRQLRLEDEFRNKHFGFAPDELPPDFFIPNEEN
jgi:hypothetical protein